MARESIPPVPGPAGTPPAGSLPAGTPDAGTSGGRGSRGPDSGQESGVGELLWTLAALREHCPWTGALTHESLVEYLLEEAYEVAETIEGGGDEAELKGELGDILLQVVLHARLAEERGTFTFGDVARGLTAKMVRRNPHVFRPDGSLQESFPATVEEIVLAWDAAKKAEKPDRRHDLEGVPAALPALARAQKLLDRAERAGYPVLPPPGPAGAAATPAPATEEELGELLFSLVAAARTRGLDAERALRVAARRFQDGHGGSHTATS